MIFQIFGSPSSTDIDVIIFVDTIPPTTKEAADLCREYKVILKNMLESPKKINTNIACLTDGYITAVHKGTIDELNNSLYYTYVHHDQHYAQQVQVLLPRNREVKMLRCARKILSFLSRTHLRKVVKLALQGDFKQKIDVLETIKLTDFHNFGKKGSPIEFRKAAAFQLGQTLALLNNRELYTKEDIGEYYTSLRPFLMRKAEYDMSKLQAALERFVEVSREHMEQIGHLKE